VALQRRLRGDADRRQVQAEDLERRACTRVVVFTLVRLLERALGRVGLIVLRKAFGIILLAISIKLFAGNITYLFPHDQP